MQKEVATVKKRLLALTIFLFSIFIVGCSSFSFPFTFTQVHLTTTVPTTRPNTATGTVTFIEDDYSEYLEYRSISYDLTIEQYNDLLITSRDLIRRSNIQISSTLYEVRDTIPWGTTTTIVGLSRGSGVIFLEDDTYYYALTNFHVVDDEGYLAEYEIKTFEDTDFSLAQIVTYNEELDLAVIKFSKNNRTEVHLINIEERVYTKFNPGELVLAVGNPLSLENNVTFGEYQNLETIENYQYKTIFHNATINEGSSGGALTDIDANLLGINTWGVVETDEYSFAIPNYIVYMFLVNEGLVNN